MHVFLHYIVFIASTFESFQILSTQIFVAPTPLLKIKYLNQFKSKQSLIPLLLHKQQQQRN